MAEPTRDQPRPGTVTLTILSGLPGAGKTTLARELQAAAPRGTIGIVSRDTVREHVIGLTMQPGDQILDRAGEDTVTAVTEAQARALLASGCGVIIDATNLDPAYIDRWQTIAAEHDADVEVIRLDIPVEECIRRDTARAAAGGRHVGADVITAMAATGRPTYEPQTHWQDWGSRRTFGLYPAAWPQDPGQQCGAPSPNDGQDERSRETGHPGRHMATYGPSARHAICSAWPGAHAPRKEDLA